MAKKSELIVKPLRGIGKLFLRVSAKACTLTAAVAADSRGTLTLTRARGARDDDDRDKYRAGPDDMPTEREKRDTPLQFGA